MSMMRAAQVVENKKSFRRPTRSMMKDPDVQPNLGNARLTGQGTDHGHCRVDQVELSLSITILDSGQREQDR
jgi:hypothetical protein